MSMATAQNAGHLAALAFGIGDGFQVRGIAGLAADVGVGETAQDVVARNNIRSKHDSAP
jgi:hypothetical protein